jgi:DNA topoisomerase-1
MKPAVYDTLQVDIAPLEPPQNASLGYLFRATGSTLRFAGFLKVYGVDEDAETARSTPQKQANYQQKNQPAPDNPQMPALQAGDWLNLHQLLPKQHFTQPPARYTEAGLIGELKKRGLGRPSTYATIVETLKKRGYVQHINKRMAPSDLGFQVCELLEKHLQTVVDVDFTARMEADLDAIAAGERSRLGVVREFYEPFQAVVAQAEQAARAERQPAAKASRAQGGGGRKQSTASRASSRRGSSRKKAAKKLPQSERAGEVCPTCQQGELVVRSGKYGPFLGCSRFREGCRYTEKVG